MLETKLKKATYDETVAFGLGFGGTEAILFGLGSLLNVLPFWLNPALIGQIPVAQREAVLASLNAPSIMAFAPIVEPAFTILVHVFATALVHVAVVGPSTRLFWFSFLHRAVLDAMVPGFERPIGEASDSVVMTYLVELVIVIYGSLGLLGTRCLRGKAPRPRDTTLHQRQLGATTSVSS